MILDIFIASLGLILSALGIFALMFPHRTMVPQKVNRERTRR